MRIRVVSPKNLKNSDSSKKVSNESGLSLYEQSFIFSHIETFNNSDKRESHFVISITFSTAFMDNLSMQIGVFFHFRAIYNGIFG